LVGLTAFGLQDGQLIIKEGDALDSSSDGIYIMWEGTAQAEKGGESVHDYAYGNHFGELALLTGRDGSQRKASVRATGGHLQAPHITHCLRLSGDIFSTLSSVVSTVVETAEAKERQVLRDIGFSSDPTSAAGADPAAPTGDAVLRTAALEAAAGGALRSRSATREVSTILLCGAIHRELEDKSTVEGTLSLSRTGGEAGEAGEADLVLEHEWQPTARLVLPALDLALRKLHGESLVACRQATVGARGAV
jgi:hypothetical protein